MRTLTILAILAVLMIAGSSIAGDPIDGNDTHFQSNYLSDYYCDPAFNGETPDYFRASMCEIAVTMDGWWELPW